MAAKSLGTLTLDVVAKVGGFVQGMTKAERSSAKWRKQVEKDAAKVGKGLGVAAAAVAAATAAMVVSTVKSANEISRLSQVSNVSADSFQRYAAGAKVVGIEQGKLADIFKDTNDKIGDFMQTGAGPLADFFEQIAPQVGVTADMFRDLSGPDALQLYVSSLEKANVSQNDMTFYMEAIASDATLLLPLLRKSGEGFKLLGDEAERAGAILSGDTLTSAEQLSAAMFVMDQTTTGLKNKIMEQVLPALSDMAISFSDVAVDGAIAEDVGITLTGTIKGLAASAVGAFAALQLLGKGIAGLSLAGETATESKWYEKIIPPLLARRVYKNWSATKDVLGVVGEDLDETAQKYATLLDGIWSAGDKGNAPKDGESRIEQIAKFLKDAREAAGQTGGGFRALGKDFDKAEKDAKKTADAIQGQITALEKAAATWGMTADQVALYGLEQDGATESQLKYAKGLQLVVEGMDRAKDAQDDYSDLLKDLRTDEEVLTDQMRERLAVMDAMSGLTENQRNETAGRIAGAGTSDAPEFGGLAPEVGGPFGELLKIDKAEDELQSWYDTQLEMLETFRAERADLSSTWDEQELALKQEHDARLAEIDQARQIAQLASAEDVFGSLAGITKQFAGEQSGIYKVMFAAQKAAAIAQSMISIQQGIAMAAANPFPMNLAAMASVAAATAGLVGNITSIGLDGQAHDGIMSVPEDGTWNLKKGERVTTAETSAKLDKTLTDIQGGGSGGAPIVNLYEDSSKAGQVNSRKDDGKNVIDIFVSDIMGDGRAQKAISSKFGLQGVGR